MKFFLLFLLYPCFTNMWAQTAEHDMIALQTPPILRSVPIIYSSSVSFNSISAIASDMRGNIIVADAGNQRICKIFTTGEIRIIAGGKTGFADGKGAKAEFWSIADITVNAEGEIFVLDGQRIRKICTNGVVTTLAGFPLRGKNDGQGSEARFNMPLAIALTPDSRIFVADAGNQCLRVIQPDGRVQTLPCTLGMPSVLCVDTKGRVLVLDRVRLAIHRITSIKNVNVQGANEYVDSVLVQFPPTASLLKVCAMTLTKQNEILLLDENGSSIRKILPNNSSNVIWCGVQEQLVASDFLINKNGEIVISNARKGILHKLVRMNISGHFFKNMTISQSSMTASQFSMTKNVQYSEK